MSQNHYTLTCITTAGAQMTCSGYRELSKVERDIAERVRLGADPEWGTPYAAFLVVRTTAGSGTFDLIRYDARGMAVDARVDA